MPSTKVEAAPQLQVPSNRKRIAIVSTNNMSTGDHHSTTREGDNEEINHNPTLPPVSDTVWRIGCYQINPSTPSGNILSILYKLSGQLTIIF